MPNSLPEDKHSDFKTKTNNRTTTNKSARRRRRRLTTLLHSNSVALRFPGFVCCNRLIQTRIKIPVGLEQEARNGATGATSDGHPRTQSGCSRDAIQPTPPPSCGSSKSQNRNKTDADARVQRAQPTETISVRQATPTTKGARAVTQQASRISQRLRQRRRWWRRERRIGSRRRRRRRGKFRCLSIPGRRPERCVTRTHPYTHASLVKRRHSSPTIYQCFSYSYCTYC